LRSGEKKESEPTTFHHPAPGGQPDPYGGGRKSLLYVPLSGRGGDCETIPFETQKGREMGFLLIDGGSRRRKGRDVSSGGGREGREAR